LKERWWASGLRSSPGFRCEIWRGQADRLNVAHYSVKSI
jgi:hypothetical protein